MDLATAIIRAVERHPAVRRVRLVGSRATGEARAESDWDFLVETTAFDSVADALPQLSASLRPIAQQWDRLSDEACWMLILPGAIKVDLIFPDVPHTHEPPWEPRGDNLRPLDAHFWDWMLWLRAKEATGKRERVAAELRKLFDHLLGPLGAERIPRSVADAVDLYRVTRADAERRFGVEVPRDLEAEVTPALES
jgi:hypothetical protein